MGVTSKPDQLRGVLERMGFAMPEPEPAPAPGLRIAGS
jgi:hypothetical protein